MKKHTNISPTSSMRQTDGNLPDCSHLTESQLPGYAQGYAERELRIWGKVQPTCLLLTDTGVVAFHYLREVRDAADDDQFARITFLLAGAHKATAVALVVEATTDGSEDCQNADSWPEPPNPSGRLECIIIKVETERSTVLRLMRIKRDAQGVFAEFDKDSLFEDEVTGSIVKTLPPQPVSKEESALGWELLNLMGVLRPAQAKFAVNWN